jgi:O-antigen/teichoic acid export membrane protein
LALDAIGSKVFKGALWLTLTRLFVNALGFLGTIVLARLLTPADFGIVAIAASILAIGMSITDLSLATALVQRTAVEDDHFHTVWTISLARSALIAIVVAALAIPLSRLYDDPKLAPVIAASGVIAALPGLASPKLALFTRSLVFRQDFVLQASEKLLVFLVSVGTAVAFRSYWALIVGNLAGALTTVALSYWMSPYLPRFGLKNFKEMISFSFWLSMGNTVNTLNWRMDQLLLGFLIGKSALGTYTVADNLSALPVRESTTPLRKTLFPAFSRIADDPVRLRQAYIRTQGLLCAISLPVGFGFAAVADPAVRVFLGSQWLAAIPIIQILSGTFAFQAFSNSLEPLAMAKGATRMLFGRDVRTLLIRVPFVVGGYLAGGLLGVVIGRAISSAIGTIWNMALVRTLSGIPITTQFTSCWRGAVATVTMVLAVVGIQRLLSAELPNLSPLGVLATSIAGGGLVFVGAAAMLWLLTGKRSGPEAEIANVLSRLNSRFNKNRSVEHAQFQGRGNT